MATARRKLLLILTIVLCVAGLIAACTMHLRRTEIGFEIRQMGGDLSPGYLLNPSYQPYDSDIDAVTFVVQDLSPSDYERLAEILPRLPKLRWLRFVGIRERLDDRALDELSRLPQVEHVTIDEANITDAGLFELRKLPSLRVVCLDRTHVTLEGIRKLDADRRQRGRTIEIWSDITDGLYKPDDASPGK